MDEIRGYIVITIIATAALWLMVRPRKPKVIYAHFNRMLIRALFFPLVSIFLLIDVWKVIDFFFPQLVNQVHPFVGTVLITGGLGCGIVLNTLYVLYWSQPFSQKRTGVKAVDEAVERYRKSGERVADAWAPALALNYRRYRNAWYVGKRKEWLVVDEKGKVLQDEAPAHTLRDMLRTALQITHPEYINQRTNAYMASQKGIKGMTLLLERFDALMSPVREMGGEKYESNIRAVKKAAEVGLRFQQGMCEYWLIEADWGNKHRGTHLKELKYEDWRYLMDQLHEKVLWLRDEIETLEEGFVAAKNILRLARRKNEIERRSAELKYLLEVVVSQKVDLEEAFEDLKAGRVRGYEKGMEKDELDGWRSRLAWVEQVDRQAGRTA